MGGDGYVSAHLKLEKAPADPCMQAEVDATAATFVATTEAPDVNLGLGALASAHVVRASPLPAKDPCPTPIDATRIVIIQ